MARRPFASASSDEQDAEPVGLAETLRTQTKPLHTAAERSGIIRELLAGTASRQGYALLLRNLLPVYRALESGLDRHLNSRGFRELRWPALYRATAIESDLVGLSGQSWCERLPLLSEANCYARRVTEAANGSGARLMAHAYVRYLGDLSGGQILKRLLIRSLSLEESSLAYYEFSDVEDIATFKTQFRNTIDRAATEIGEVASVIDEAVTAFGLNIAVSEAVFAISHV
jgi:heme oxygenase (biliverdin-producing, ferredoxin)